MSEITPEQRAAAEAVMAEVMAGLGWDGRAWRNEAGLALEALIAEGWGPDTTRAKAEADLAEHRDAMVEARKMEPASGETVKGALARLRREALVKASWCEADEDWIGVIENLAQADAYEYAVAGPVGEVCEAAEARGYQAGLEAAAREAEHYDLVDSRSGGAKMVHRNHDQIARAIRALADNPKETSHG